MPAAANAVVITYRLICIYRHDHGGQSEEATHVDGQLCTELVQAQYGGPGRQRAADEEGGAFTS